MTRYLHRLIRAFATWNPAMWVSFSGMSALLAASDLTAVSIIAGIICLGLQAAATAVTLKGGK